MLSVRLPALLEKRLNSLVKKTGRTKTFYIKKALEQFLEDYEDYLSAMAVLEQNNPSKSVTEVIKELGLEDEVRQYREKATDEDG